MQPLFFSPSLATPTASGGTVAQVVRHWYSPRGVEQEMLDPVPWLWRVECNLKEFQQR